MRDLTTYIATGLIALLTSTTALATAPSTPTDLRADVYSLTAAEIFWSRSTDSDGLVSGYEVRQDGEVVATFDGLSFFIDALSEGVSTEFSVTAIDSDNERSGAASITVTSGNANGVSSNTDDRPMPPANLNAIVYSATAAEVFWDRNSDRPLTYEVSLNGMVVTTTNGSSYFNGDLDTGSSFAIDVIAIDANGQRSGAASVVVNSNGDTNSSQPPSQPNSQLASPTNLRLEVYSGTAGELFWDRSAQAGEIETTEVRRDGVALATTQGTSFFDNTRTAGVAYRYEVVFLGFNDAQSGPAVFDESGSSATPPPFTNAPPAPANARIIAYSGTAAELFWDRAEPSANITETQVLRNGSLIGSTQGNSFFDGSRVSGVEYRYELQNINSNGVRSEVTVLGETSEVQTPTTPSTTLVTFGITVPAYMSNELQVRIESGDINTTAAFVRDESWSVSEDFLINTDNPLVVTFADRNGAITLGAAETSFRTGTATSETVQITVGQFDTERFDNDSDGVSNLDELIAGTDPLESVESSPSTESPSSPELPQAVLANLELVIDKTFRLSWQATEAADFYRVLENSNGISGFIQISDDLGPAVQTFDHRVALYKRFNASYIVQACNASGCVDSAEQFVTGTLEQAIGYLKASNTEFEDFFGDTVSLSSDGNTLAVGASGRFTLIPGFGESDAVYVFQRNDGNWVTQAVLRSNTDDGFAAGFGNDISLSSDGNTLAVGATGEQIVYVFTRTDGTWATQALIEASNGELGDGFGAAVSLNAEGNILVASAPAESSSAIGVNGDQGDNSARAAGAVYVLELSDGAWQQQAYLKASNTEASDRFGINVSLSPDGSTIAVAAQFEDSAATGVNGDQDDNAAVNAGAVYVFVRSSETWQQQAYLKASNTRRSNGLGSALSLSFEGDTLAVGSAFFDNNRDDSLFETQGAVYTFTRIDDIWQQQAFLQASNSDSREFFGTSVSLSADGNTLAVGAPQEDSEATGINGSQITGLPFSQGAVYTFSRSDAVWQQQAYVKASNTDRGQFFGQAVSLSLDGRTLAVGAQREGSAATGVNGDQNDNSAPFAGAVYLY